MTDGGEIAMSKIMHSRVRPALNLPQWTRRAPGPDTAPMPARVARIAGNVPGISVAIVHHNPIAREGLGLLLSRQQDMLVVGTRRADQDSLGSPDIILLSLNARDTDAVRTVSAVVTAAPDAKVIVLAASTDLACVAQQGVFGFVLEEASSDELLRTIRSVARGIHVWPPSVAKPLFSHRSRDRSGRRAAADRATSRLTRREREVMMLIAEGLRTKDIAQKLGIASFTVRAHVRNIMEKLDMHTRLQIAAHVHHERLERPQTTPTPPADDEASGGVEAAPMLERCAM
jgi:DNA-binding NarL/FixJ family response regulator